MFLIASDVRTSGRAPSAEVDIEAVANPTKKMDKQWRFNRTDTEGRKFVGTGHLDGFPISVPRAWGILESRFDASGFFELKSRLKRASDSL